MVRYLDKDGLSYGYSAAYIKALNLQYDKELTDPLEIRADDVVITGPFLAHRWSYLPRTVEVQIVPDGGELKRTPALVHAVNELKLPKSYLKSPPTPKAKKYTEYQQAVSWAESHYVDPWTGKSEFPYELIQDGYRAGEVLSSLQGKLYAIDYETDGFDGPIVGVALADKDMSWYITGRGLVALPGVIDLLKSHAGIAHNSSYEYRTTARNSLYQTLPTDIVPLYDTQVLNWVITSKPGTSRLKVLAHDELGRTVLTFEDVVPPGTDIKTIDPDRVARYAAAGDARNTYDLFLKLRERALAEGLWRVYNEIERPLTPVLAELELYGFPVDLDEVQRITQEYVVKRARLRKSLAYLGCPMPITPDGVAHWFYNELKLPVLKMTDSGSRGAVDSPTLEELKKTISHPALSTYAAYQDTVGILTKFCFPLLKANSDTVFPQIRQTSTRTGRLSYKEPNLQQMEPRVRKALTAKQGMVLFSSDYSSEEPRIASVVANDFKMQEDFRQGRDPYLSLGVELGMSENEAKAKRQALKVNFLAWMYGQASEYAARLSEARPDFVRWRQSVIQVAHDTGAAYTLEGRRRLLPEIWYRDPRIQAKAEREAINMPIQGTAADIGKLGLPLVFKLIKKLGVQPQMIAIHDEVVGLWTPDMEREYGAQRDALLVDCYPKVPLKIETHAGRNWYEAKYGGDS